MAIDTRVRETATAPPGDGRPAARGWFVLMLVGGLLGAVAAGWQLVERIAYVDGADTGICEINSVLSCSSIFSHWQSSALGVTSPTQGPKPVPSPAQVRTPALHTSTSRVPAGPP